MISESGKALTAAVVEIGDRLVEADLSCAVGHRDVPFGILDVRRGFPLAAVAARFGCAAWWQSAIGGRAPKRSIGVLGPAAGAELLTELLVQVHAHVEDSRVRIYDASRASIHHRKAAVEAVEAAVAEALRSHDVILDELPVLDGAAEAAVVSARAALEGRGIPMSAR